MLTQVYLQSPGILLYGISPWSKMPTNAAWGFSACGLNRLHSAKLELAGDRSGYPFLIWPCMVVGRQLLPYNHVAPRYMQASSILGLSICPTAPIPCIYVGLLGLLSCTLVHNLGEAE